ncbi:MAG: riboflavin synthase [Phycisphaerales bacterium]|nr:riboflavin synthase [Phycisphaerales bacterium]
MFTGIVQTTGRVLSATPGPGGVRLAIDTRGWAHRSALGDSIAVNGCCLTVAAIDDGRFEFDVVPETLRKTTLGTWGQGRRVNLEHAATVATLLGGHLVQGHVDGRASVQRSGATPDGGWELAIECEAALAECLVPQGSICIDGVSLTVAGLRERTVRVCLIPTTLGVTNLGELRDGDEVNVEADVISKQVVAFLRRRFSRE